MSSARLLDVIKGRLTFVRRLCDSFKLSQPDRGAWAHHHTQCLDDT